jgi:hypothetical protein
MMVETTMSSPPFTSNKDIPSTVHHVCQDRLSLWFSPATSQFALDILMDKLDQVSTNLPVSQVFPGELCAAKLHQQTACTVPGS